MVNVRKLKGRMVELDISVELLAKQVGINKSSLYRKLKEGNSFSIGEAKSICNILQLSPMEAIDIFFADIAPKMGIKEEL